MDLNLLYEIAQFVDLVDLLDKYDWNEFYEIGLVHEYDVEAKYIWNFYKENPNVGVDEIANYIAIVFMNMLMCIPPWEECLECAEIFMKIMEE